MLMDAKRKGKAPYWAHLEIVVVGEGDGASSGHCRQSRPVSFMAALTDRQQHEGGKLAIISTVEDRREWWLKYASQSYPWLAKAAVRLLSMHVTTCAAERNWSVFGNVFSKARSRLAVSRAEKLVFIKANMGAQYNEGDSEILLDVMEEGA